MRWIVRVLAAAFVLAAGLGNAQPAPRRIALVIGNGAYQVPAWRLANPPRDAALIAAKLRALGFEVDAVNDVTRASMDAAFERFGGKLKSSGPDTVGLFYYAGHGAQGGGVNFLVPVDANAATADRLRYQSPSMQFLLDDMAEAGNAVNIIILDACRDMPLPDGSRSIGRGGLADVGRLPNVFIAYATAPGRTAADGGGANSPFTSVLAAALDAQASEPISLLFDDVNARVYERTGGGQAPEYRAGLVRAPRWSFAAPRVAGVDPELERLRRENETLRKAGTAPNPQSTRPTPVSAANDAGEVARAPGTEFDDCNGAGWCPRMIVIPSGRFLMGSADSGSVLPGNEGPVHAVSVRSFAAGKFEATFEQWTACANDGGCSGYAPEDHGYGRGNRPVLNVSWEDAKRYVQWMTNKTGKAYRLLTEAEWEYAARGGTTTSFSWGDIAEHAYANYGGGQNLRGLVSGRDQWRTTAPVGSFAANPFGVHDMHGNVWEWVEDCYHNDYLGAPTDGSAWISSSCTSRVVRGGAWGSFPDDLRSSKRSWNAPTYRVNILGLRLARSL